jgi:hypothetical protein
MTTYREGEVLGPEVPGERETRERLRFLAWLLDSSIRIPGTRFTIGLEALIGLVPFLGDLLGVLVSSYIVAEARRLGASRSVLARMAFNVAVEGVVGLIPVAGDVFDAAWKANQRNVRLLESWVERPRRAQRASTTFVALVVLAIVAFAAVTIYLTYLLLRWLVS